MTFKHVKFEDSPTMRSLEKVAKEKGLATADPIVKQAEKKTNLTPSHDLMTNVIKLCEGLRQSGMVKHAEELETNFLNYKQAQTLYEAHKEKGEDLVEFAHPEGSHKLENVEGDEAIVEDILDKHMKILQVVEKEPKGKLASKEAIQAVRIVLGQVTIPEVQVVGQAAPQTEDELKTALTKQSGIVLQFLGTTIAKIKDKGNLDEYTKNDLDETGKEFRLALSESPFTADSYRNCQLALKKIKEYAEEGDFASHWYQSSESDEKGVSLWNTYVAPSITQLTSNLGKLLPITKKLDEIRVAKEQGTYKEPVKAPPVSPAKSQLASRIKIILATIARGRALYPQRVPAQYQGRAKASLDNWETAAKTESTFLDGLDPNELQAQQDRIGTRLSSLEGWVNEFMTEWLGER